MAKTTSVPSSWLGLTNMLSARPLIALDTRVKEKGIDPHDLPAVEQAWQELHTEARGELEQLDRRAADRKQEAERDVSRTREIEDTLPDIRRKQK